MMARIPLGTRVEVIAGPHVGTRGLVTGRTSIGALVTVSGRRQDYEIRDKNLTVLPPRKHAAT